MVDLSVVIVSYNVRELLAQCLNSVLEAVSQRELRSEIFVVDNASSDGSAQMVRESYAEVRLIANASNVGFAAANNQALRRCDGRYLLLLNPDAQLRQGALDTLLGFLDRQPEAAMAGPKLLYPDGSLQHSAFQFPGLAQIFLDFFPVHHRLTESGLNGRYPRAWYEGDPFVIDHPLGACMAVRQAAVEEVGLLDEGFFMYCEEIDWCVRMKDAGWAIYCVPEAEVIHHEAQSTRQFRDEMFVALWRSRFRLFQKHRNSLFQLSARWLVRLGLAAEMLRARWQRQRGQLGSAQMASRLGAYQRVWGLAGG